MQYSKGRAIPIAVDRTRERLPEAMLRLLSKRASFLVLALPVLIFAGCSDSLTSAGPSPSTFAASTKQLGKTLSPAEQKAAIADLQGETSRREGGSAETTASTKPAQAQN
jgi:hypothetical protein